MDIYLFLYNIKRYESAPMYVTNQNYFLNSVISGKSLKNPHELLKAIKDIELKMGRTNTNIKNGPRIIDIDILKCFDNNGKQISVTDNDLIVPHPRIHERNFVYEPLNEIISEKYRIENNQEINEEIDDIQPHHLKQILPLSVNHEYYHTLKDFDRDYHRTLLMGIVNMTPDSFSDGGKWIHDMDKLLRYIDECIEYSKLIKDNNGVNGVNILDIGGQSTRPGSDIVGTQLELERVTPIIDRIKQHFDKENIILSIDTFDSQVACECVKNYNVDIINDISGGLMDENMFNIVSEYGVSYIMSHIRGTPATMMSNKSNLIYKNGVLTDIKTELSFQIKKALQHGIPKWNIILDPGIGFAKTSQDNQIILQNITKIKPDPRIYCTYTH